MSVNDLPSGASGAVASQAEAVLREAQALSAALDRSKTIRRLLMLAFLVFVLVVAWVGFGLYKRVTSEAYLKDLQQMAQKQFDGDSDRYVREARKLADKVSPVVREAFMDRAKKDTPAYLQAMQKESDLFVKNLQEQLVTKLEEFQEKSMVKNRALIEQEFPAAQDPKVQERLAINMRLAIEDLTKKYYVHQMRDSMGDLFKQWENIPAAAEPGKNQLSIEEQFIGALMNVLSTRLTQPPPA